MNILKNSEIFGPTNIATIERDKSAIYVCDTCLRNSDGWVNDSVAIFYQPDVNLVPEGGSQYFGLYYRRRYGEEDGRDTVLMITNAISAVEEPITGVVAKNGDVIYSRLVSAQSRYRSSTAN